MYYTDRVHQCKKKYTEERIKWKDNEYIPQVELKEEKYNPYQIMQIKYKPRYEEEEYYTREYGDIPFNTWLLKQNNKCIAILAEIVDAPRLDPVIERLRPQVSQMKTITIDEYRKIKCIGSTKVEWLKQMKKKYGINILRFLYATTREHQSCNNPISTDQKAIQHPSSRKR
jgi:hypothetical protein